MPRFLSLALAGLLAAAPSAPAMAEVPRVVTDIPPVGALVAQVMGDLGAPRVLLEGGGDPHAFQLRPSQAADLAAAQAVIWIGPELTPWLDRAMAQTQAQDIRLLALPGTTRRGHDQDDGHGSADPHAWLDPANAGVWLRAVAAALSGLDPANAATYAANAAAAEAALLQLDARLRAQLAPARTTPLVFFHSAYGYFTDRYGLTVLGALRDGDAASPGAAHLRDLQARIAGQPVCLFPEANHDARPLSALDTTPGVRIGAALDPEGSGLPGGPALYADLLRQLADAIAACAG